MVQGIELDLVNNCFITFHVSGGCITALSVCVCVYLNICPNKQTYSIKFQHVGQG